MLSKGFIKKFVIYIPIIFLINLIIFNNFSLQPSDMTLCYTFTSGTPGILQVFYAKDYNELEWTEENSQKINYTNINTTQNIEFSIPSSSNYLRIDFYEQSQDTVISDLQISYKGKFMPLDTNEILDNNNLNQISNISVLNNSYIFKTTDNDPYVKYKINNSILNNILQQNNTLILVLRLLLCFSVDLLYLLILKKSSLIINLIRDLFKNKDLIWSLSKNDFKTKYAGSYLGIFWAFIQPIVTILTYWFVFEYGLKAGSPLTDVPFVLWFVSGLVPWFFFQESLINATNCMIEYSYLVKKVLFNINILPIVKIISSLFVHFVFIGFTVIIFLINKRFSGIYNLQLLYYSFSCFILVLSISYVTSSIIVFFKDLGQFITIVLQILMWMTPIMWSKTILPANLNWFPFFNPVFYIVDGYRDSLIGNKWFWEKPLQTIYFWTITLMLFLLGSIIFKKLKSHFADVL